VRKDTTGSTSDSQGMMSTSSTDRMWSRGLGFEVSPLKTRSARRKAGTANNPLPTTTTTFDLEVLRGLKALARAKI